MWFSVDTSPESMRLEVTNLLPALVNSTSLPEHIFLTLNYTQVPIHRLLLLPTFFGS